jgi:tripartite-type tricarboxylate transporter receptor subunit TctC
MKTTHLAIAALALAALGTLPGAAQNYPTKPISIVIPLGAGGAMDSITRTLAEQLSQRLGQPVVIENKPGGGMVIGSSAVAQAEPDGHTLMNAPSGAYVINPTLYKKLSYDPNSDFVPVALYARIPFVLVVNPALPVNSVKDLIQYSKDNPGKLSYAASTIGAVIHLSGELLKHEAGLNMVMVPYKQGGPASLNDVVAGHVPVTFADPSLVKGLIEGGKIRAIGVSSKTRMPSLPDVPTLDESGVKGFEAVSWHMIVAPAKTPKPVVDKLHAEIKAIVAQPAVHQRMLQLGLIPVDSPSVEGMRKYIESENNLWGGIIRKAGIAGTM